MQGSNQPRATDWRWWLILLRNDYGLLYTKWLRPIKGQVSWTLSPFNGNQRNSPLVGASNMQTAKRSTQCERFKYLETEKRKEILNLLLNLDFHKRSFTFPFHFQPIELTTFHFSQAESQVGVWKPSPLSGLFSSRLVAIPGTQHSQNLWLFEDAKMSVSLLSASCTVTCNKSLLSFLVSALNTACVEGKSHTRERQSQQTHTCWRIHATSRTNDWKPAISRHANFKTVAASSEKAYQAGRRRRQMWQRMQRISRSGYSHLSASPQPHFDCCFSNNKNSYSNQIFCQSCHFSALEFNLGPCFL